MPVFEYKNVKITGLACASPTNKKDTDEYKKYFEDDEVEKFKKTTGIKSRYFSNGKQTASDLCYVAAKKIMESKEVPANEIGALIFVTQTPDYKTPSTAFVLHKRLGLSNDCMVYDINLGCSGFVVGLATVGAMIESGLVGKALILVGDADMEHPVVEDHSFSMMFGDCGSACLVERGDSCIRGIIRSDGNGFDTMITPVPGARFPNKNNFGINDRNMSGSDTFSFTIREVPVLFKDFFTMHGTSVEDYDYVMLHQANEFILKYLAKKMKLPKEKMPSSIDKYGNTDGASIPLGIVDLCSDIESGKDLRLICSGFGIGLSWGVVDFNINTNDVIPLIFTDDYYEDGFLGE